MPEKFPKIEKNLEKTKSSRIACGSSQMMPRVIKTKFLSVWGVPGGVPSIFEIFIKSHKIPDVFSFVESCPSDFGNLPVVRFGPYERQKNRCVLLLKGKSILKNHIFESMLEPTSEGVKSTVTLPGGGTSISAVTESASHHHLRGIVEHHGPAGFGHYTSYVRDQSNQWYHCDDTLPPASRNVAQVMTAQPHILVYER